MKHLVAVCPVVLCAGVLASCPLASAIEPNQHVESSFELFNQQWMEHLYRREEKNRANVACKQVDDAFVAEYTGYSRTFTGRTKKTDCKETPYIGILHYQEQTFVSRGKTYDEVLVEICGITSGPVSAEVVADDVDGMLREGRHFARLAPNIVVRVPMSEEGLEAAGWNGAGRQRATVWYAAPFSVLCRAR